MNYEEMLDARNHREILPLGTFCRKLIDKKYRSVIELRDDLKGNAAFCDALKEDVALTNTSGHSNQLHFEVKEGEGGITEIELATGNYIPFHQLLIQNPAVVAGKDYVGNVINLLADMLKELHRKKVYQCCLAPQFIFARKSDNMPMLLCHGSLYTKMDNRRDLYQGMEEFVAPEVLHEGTADERSDVYALGRFIQRLYAEGSMDYEYKAAVAVATDPDPDKRYDTIELMLYDIAKKRSMHRSVISLVAAVAVGLLCLFVYMDMMPEPVDVEFVKPVEEDGSSDPYDASLTAAELGLDPNDSIFLDATQQAEQADLDAEVERIFRRQFTREAEKTISLVYSEENMNTSEQTFIAGNNSMMEGLIRKRDALVTQSGIDKDKANRIASEIITQLQAQQKKKLKSYGYQGKKEDE